LSALRRGGLSFKPHLRIEWRSRDGENETSRPGHSASLGYSIASSTQIELLLDTPLPWNGASLTPALASSERAQYVALLLWRTPFF
jgi:hypothetical protein